jgi:purine-nucleoside/S-methyl-5'-thioadenosine phosphorylase / adenosine deaminase
MQTAVGDSTLFRFDDLDHFPLVQAVTTRNCSMPGDGDINIAGRLPLDEAIANRRVWADLIGIDASELVAGRQVHGTHVHVVDEQHRGLGALRIEDAIPQTDALITRTPGLPLTIYTADCVPVLVYDPVEHALGLAHAGWRGTVGNIAGAVVAAMRAEFGSQPANLIVRLGPSIGPCCYEVGDEVIDAWRASGVDHCTDAIQPKDPRAHLDLWRANSLAFEAAGVLAGHVETSGICTRCHAERFFSRRAGQGHRGLFATIAQLQPRPHGGDVQDDD